MDEKSKSVALAAEKARDLVRFQLRHLDVLADVGARYPAGQVREVDTVDLFLHEDDFAKAKKYVEETAPWFPDFEFKMWKRGEEMRDKVSRALVSLYKYKYCSDMR